MKDGSIDALFWSGGLPTPGITDLLTTSAAQVTFLVITPVRPALQQINPVYEQGVIPAAAYRTPADVPTIVVPNLMLVRNDLDANVACVLTRARPSKPCVVTPVTFSGGVPRCGMRRGSLRFLT